MTVLARINTVLSMTPEQVAEMISPSRRSTDLFE
jgi:hypothetical protein